VRTAVYLSGALTIAVTLAGCEPESITAARDTLGLGPKRTLSLEIPVTVDTFTVSEILTDWLGISTIVIADNLVAVEANPQTVSLDVAGGVGTFTNVPLDSSLLQFAVEEEMQFSAAGLNLGEFQEAAEEATVHTALIALEVTNTADAPLTLQDFTLGVVMVDPGTGSIRRVAGLPAYETDESGTPILVDVADPGLTTFAIGRQSLKIDTLQAAAVVDRLVDSLLAGSQVALVGAGTAKVGDGSVGSVAAGDQLSISARPIIGFDFSIPQTGVSLDSSTAREGLDLDDPNANDIEARVDSAGALLRVTNSTPFGLQLDIDLVADSVADAFSEPNRVSLTSIVVAPALVDGNGRVTEASRDTVFVGLTGASVRPFLGEWFTAGVRITLTPPVGGRGAIRTTDLVIVDATAVMHLRVGGGQ
jgi:hypothetical protein